MNTQNQTTPTASRFDYVEYDNKAVKDQMMIKTLIGQLEDEVNTRLECGRSKALVMTKLEEAYMWIGKGIRNDQIARNGSANLQEKRGNQ